MPFSFAKIFRGVELFRDGAYFFHWAQGELDTKQHQHSKAQFVYAEGGYFYIEIDSKVWFLPARHYMWIPPGVAHRTWSPSSSVKMFTIYFDMKDNDADFYKHTGIYFVNDLLREMILFTSTWDGHIDRGDKSKYFFAMAIRAILPDMDTRNALLKYTLPVPKDERLSKIESHIRSHLTEPISIGQLAERFGMSTRTLSRLFMQDLGMSYIQFLRAIRMITAFELLVENKHTIKEIAYKLGYSSVPTFSNVFYQGTGIRPTQYMNLRKTENPNLPSALSS